MSLSMINASAFDPVRSAASPALFLDHDNSAVSMASA